MNHQSHQDIFAQELESWRQRGARIIDVREPSEYQNGHVPGAENIPLGEIAEHGAQLEGPIVLVCAGGNRSGNAAQYLSAIGKDDIANLTGGTFGYAQHFPLE